MAKVVITGNVSNLSDNGRFTLWEKFDVNGKQVFRKWTVWFSRPVGLADLDWVEVEGTLGTKVGSYEKNGETKAVVEHSLNDPRLVQHVPSDVGMGKAKAEETIDEINAPF